MIEPGVSTTPASHDPYASLRFPNYRLFIVSLLTMTAAAQVQEIVVAWQLYAITHDPLSLGLVGLAEALPFISVALYAGHIADRVNRRQVAVIALVVLLLCALALLLYTARMPRTGRPAVWPFYAIIFVSGIARSFLQPARTALGAELIPREVYANAVAWRSSTWQLAAVLGPALGGVLYAWAGSTVAYSVDIALTGIALFTLAHVAYEPRITESERGSIGESLTTGIRFVLGHPVILGALTLDLFSVLFGGAVALLPVFASEILHVGPQGLGAMRAAPAAGAVVMSLMLAHRPPMRRAGRSLLVAVALFGVSMLGFALSRSFVLSLALLAFSGMVDMVSVVLRSTMLQVLTPSHLLGRVSSVNAIFIGSSNEIGAFESGVAAKVMGTVPSVLFGGMMTLAVVVVIAWRVPSLRKLERIG
jgi:MFS family permease